MRVNARVWEQEIVLKRAVRQRSRWPTKVRPRMGHQRSSPENIPFENRNEPSGVSIVLLVSHYLNLSHPGGNSVQGSFGQLWVFYGFCDRQTNLPARAVAYRLYINVYEEVKRSFTQGKFHCLPDGRG